MRVTDSSEHSAESGFTLVELMISLVLFSFAVAGVLAVAVSMTQGFREQRQAMSAESSVRVPIEFIADALRQVSPGVPNPTLLIDASTCETGAIQNMAANNQTTGPDALDIIYASGAVVTTTTASVDDTSATIPVTNALELNAGDYVLLTNFTTQAHLFKVLSKTVNVLTLDAKCALAPFNYPTATTVIRAQHARFYIAADPDNVPTLYMDPDGVIGPAAGEPLAEGIEDMQVVYGVDADATGGIVEGSPSLATDEWHYNAAGDAAPPMSATVPIRSIRVTLVARARQSLVGNAASFARPAIEDHPVGSADAYRRRTARVTVEIRNITGSP